MGLRLRAHSQERAITQWRDVLQGEVEETPAGSLLFRRPGSPLRLVVDVDAPLDAASARLGIRLTRQQGGD